MVPDREMLKRYYRDLLVALGDFELYVEHLTKWNCLAPVIHPFAVLSSFHKVRYLYGTDKQREKSLQWLSDRKFKPCSKTEAARQQGLDVGAVSLVDQIVTELRREQRSA